MDSSGQLSSPVVCSDLLRSLCSPPILDTVNEMDVFLHKVSQCAALPRLSESYKKIIIIVFSSLLTYTVHTYTCQRQYSDFTLLCRVLFHFHYLCAEVSGQRSSALAADPKRDQDRRRLWFDPAGWQWCLISPCSRLHFITWRQTWNKQKQKWKDINFKSWWYASWN